MGRLRGYLGVLGGMDGSRSSGGGVGGKVEEVSDCEEGRSRTNSIEPSDTTEPNVCYVKWVCTNTTERKQKLGRFLAEVGPTLCWQDKHRLRQLLLRYHQAFAVDEGDRGETDLMQMTIYAISLFVAHRSPPIPKLLDSSRRCSPGE